MLSKDETKTRNAIKAINAMDTLDAVNAYIAGEDRPDVLDAAQVQIEFIENQGQSSPSDAPSPAPPTGGGATSGEDEKAKQGEQPGPITQKTDEFKGPGVQGTKSAVASPLAGDDASRPASSEGTSRGEGAASGAGKDPIAPNSELRTLNPELPKGGISGSDIIESLDKTALNAAKESELRAAETEKKNEGKSEAEIRQEKGIVTCEDVLNKQRAEGKKV
jgi:hypothetical protein